MNKPRITQQVWLYMFCRFLCWVVCKVFGRIQIIGRENIPEKGGALLCGNHVSYIDPPAIGAGCPRPTYFMAKEPLFRVPVLGFVLKTSGTFPVRQHTADRTALRNAIDLLQNGKVVAMFPEGTRNMNPSEMMAAEPGVGMIALRSQVPVIPVALINTENLLPPHSHICRFVRIKAVFGQPVKLDDLYSQSGRDAVDEAGRRIISAIGELKAKHTR